MKIEFRKISSVDTLFETGYENLSFKGNLRREGKFVNVDARINGDVILTCDRCGCDIEKVLDEAVQIKVIEGYYDGEDLDIIESHESYIDFDQIAQSEVEAIKSEYHYCKECKQMQGE